MMHVYFNYVDEVVGDYQGPNVEHALSMSPSEAIQKQEPRKSTIGARKAPKKSGVSVHFLDKKSVCLNENIDLYCFRLGSSI